MIKAKSYDVGFNNLTNNNLTSTKNVKYNNLPTNGSVTNSSVELKTMNHSDIGVILFVVGLVCTTAFLFLSDAVLSVVGIPIAVASIPPILALLSFLTMLSSVVCVWV